MFDDFEMLLIRAIKFLILVLMGLFLCEAICNWVFAYVSAETVGTYRSNPIIGVCANHDYYIRWSESRSSGYYDVTDYYCVVWDIENDVKLEGNTLSGDMYKYYYLSGSESLNREKLSRFEVNNAQKFNIYSNVVGLGYPSDNSVNNPVIRQTERNYTMLSFGLACAVGIFFTSLCIYGKRL